MLVGSGCVHGVCHWPIDVTSMRVDNLAGERWVPGSIAQWRKRAVIVEGCLVFRCVSLTTDLKQARDEVGR